MASQHNSGTHTKFQNLVNQLTTLTGVDFDFSYSKGYSIRLAVSDDGQELVITTDQPSGPSNSFGPASGVAGHLTRAPAKKIPGNSMP